MPNVEQILARLKDQFGALTGRQLGTLAATFVLVVALVGGSAWWLTRPSYTLLFEEMDPESAADVMSRLEAQKVDYQLVPGGGGIRVPATEVDRLRLEMSAQGLPSSGRIGFEIFDRTAFGATEFLEHVNYRRALEGEIARTIATLSEVRGARVHIAMAKDSLFGARQQPAKASVVLRLRQNRPLAGETIAGITNLVAASVEGLRPEAVVIMDSYGRPLARPPAGEDEAEPLGGAQTERQQRVERDLSQRLVALLEPVAGSGRVRVNVAARLSPESEERTQETWDPATPVLRSRQMTSDVSPGPLSGAAAGIAGARANLPAPAVPEGATEQAAPLPLPAPAPGTASRATETTNYEISRTTTHTVRPRGAVARLSVAVILDDALVVKQEGEGEPTRSTRPRDPGEIQKIQGIVASAVGLDTERGDQLTVENIAFDATGEVEPAPPGLMEQYGPAAGEAGRVVAVLVLALLAFLFVVRPLMRQSLGAAPKALAPGQPGALPGVRTVQEMEGEIEAQLQASLAARQIETVKLPVLTKKANEMVQSEPESAARLLRAWLAEEPR